ncbi:MAG: hypothetical protein GWN62_24265 [Aliifodinibius sp.]|nr:hypothetical protein [Fodinibius sp.]
MITKKQLIRHFRSSGIRLGGKLRRELDSGSGIAANKKRRIKKAMDTLLNRQFDEAVTVFNIKVSPTGDKYGPFVVIYYVDENASLNQINYAESNEVTDVGDVLLPTEEFAPSNMRHVGICSLCLYLRLKGGFADNAKSYREFDEKYYLVVPSTLFNNIMEKKGQFILLDKNDSILDRVGLKELEQGPREKLGAMGK